MSVTVASTNLRFDLPERLFEAGLRKVLATNPDLVCIQEALNHRDNTLTKIASEGVYSWARADGGEPIMWRTDKFDHKSTHPIKLSAAEYVGHIPGRKDRLPASIATEVCLDDLDSVDVYAVLNYHLTAEIQDVRGGGGYKNDLAHKLRVRRHKREKRRLGRRMRSQQRRAREVYAAGDGNFSGMTIGGFVNCWGKRDGGTLQGRPVDIVFADRLPLMLKTLTTPSDHDALVVTYR